MALELYTTTQFRLILLDRYSITFLDLFTSLEKKEIMKARIGRIVCVFPNKSIEC